MRLTVRAAKAPAVLAVPGPGHHTRLRASSPRRLAENEAMNGEASDAAADPLRFADGRKFATILADPPWRFANRTGKMAPEHRRLARYGTLTLGEIASLPVAAIAAQPAHLYLWVPN